MASRPYGTGSYGTGRYGVGSGTNFEVAAQTSVSFQVRLSPTGIYGVGAATGIRTSVWGMAARIWSPMAATQVLFSTKWVGALRITTAAAQTQISFSAQGELVKTWQDATPCYVPCEAGTWGQEYPPWTERQAA